GDQTQKREQSAERVAQRLHHSRSISPRRAGLIFGAVRCKRLSSNAQVLRGTVQLAGVGRFRAAGAFLAVLAVRGATGCASGDVDGATSRGNAGAPVGDRGVGGATGGSQGAAGHPGSDGAVPDGATTPGTWIAVKRPYVAPGPGGTAPGQPGTAQLLTDGRI